MTTHLQDVLVVNVAVIAALGLSWSWGRAVRRGRPLTPVMRKMMTYGALFALGMGNIMMFGSWFAWPQQLWFVLIAAWGATLALVAWWRHEHEPPGPRGPSAPTH